MFKPFAAAAAALVCMTGPQLPEAHASADCDLLDNGVLICSKQMSSSVERLGVRDPQGRTAFVGDVTCTETEWILHGGWTGYVSQETASEYAESYCEGRGNMFV
jgi:hypothetical protein